MKSDKEAFVSGLAGGNPWELVALLSVVTGVWAVTRSHSLKPVLATVLLCLSLCASTTLLADYVKVLVGLLVLMAAVGFRFHLVALRVDARAVVDAYRGGMMMATCIAILAVDFAVFPRRFAKTEEFGFSLMDVGVGSFVLSSGLVLRSTGSLKRAALDSAVVIGLGVARFFVTTLANYQQHVSEYGTHWNFFLTMGVVSFVGRALCLANWRFGLPSVVACLILALSQLLLLLSVDYVLHAPRISWFSHNREGLVSLAGFFALLLFGVDLGRLLRGSHFVRMGFVSAPTGVVSHLLHLLVQPTSRRMANAAYVFFVLSLNSFLLVSLMLVDLSFPTDTSSIMTSISRVQLFVFIAGNLMTGAINGLVDTMNTSPMAAFCIIFLYSMVLGVFALVLARSKR